MKISRGATAVGTTACALAVVFAFFGWQLSNNQDRSRNEIRTEVHDRAVLAASLLNSLFQTVQQSSVQYSQEFGGTINATDLETTAKNNAYAVVTDSTGKVLAASSGFSPSVGLALSADQLRRIAARRSAYRLGDISPYQGGSVVDLAVPFTAGAGRRVLITGIRPASLSAFFDNQLATIPGPKGEANYLLDGRGLVLGSSDPRIGFGSAVIRPIADRISTGWTDTGGTYYDQTKLANSSWRILLAAPDSGLFSSVNGTHALVPWIIFAALVLAAGLAAGLAIRVMRSAETVKEVNERLAAVNEELTGANLALERRAAELARSNEELDSFASIASHDLQEPLRKVRTFTEQLSIIEGPNLSGKGLDYLQRANAAAERMQKLIEDLLRFSRVSTQGRPFEAVDLAEVATRVVGDLEAQVDAIGASVQIGDLPVIEADPLQMQQLLQNLISNALKFHREGVTPVVRVGSVVDGPTVRISVRDNGIGFEPRYAMRIFRIFERLHGRSEYPGTGIGLALCRKIADRHEGSIEADGEPGSGSTFTVTLPVSHPAGASGLGIELRPKAGVGTATHG